MKEYKAAVFIGRFQPFHRSHLEVVTQGLEIADKVIILVGSSRAARSFKNPFTYDERKEMIKESIKSVPGQSLAVELEDVIIRPLRDYYYNHDTWVAGVQAITDELIVPGSSVALLGAYKDASSYYLKSFPQWDHIPMKQGTIHATDIREKLYEASSFIVSGVPLPDYEGKLPHPPSAEWVQEYVPEAVAARLERWVATPGFYDAVRSWYDTRAYRASWDSAPFPPTFVTTDCVVVCSGHILVIKRKFNPGKGLYALPGGFLKQNEHIRDGALRELKEETGIRVDKIVLDSQIIDNRVFDHPDRDPRGRTVTHAFHIKLKDGVLPEVKGGDDAAGAFWMPLWDVVTMEDHFYADHAHIIQAFVGSL